MFKARTMETIIYDEEVCNELFREIKDADMYYRKISLEKWAYFFRNSVVEDKDNMSDAVRSLGNKFDWMKALKKPEIVNGCVIIPINHTWRTKHVKCIGVCVISYPNWQHYDRNPRDFNPLNNIYLLPDSVMILKDLHCKLQNYFNNAYTDFLSQTEERLNTRFVEIFREMIVMTDIRDMLKHLRINLPA